MPEQTTKLYEHLDQTEYGQVRVWLELRSGDGIPPYYALCGEIQAAGLVLNSRSVVLYPRSVALEGRQKLISAQRELGQKED